MAQLAEAEYRRAEVDAQVRAATITPDDDDETEELELVSAAELARLKKELAAAKKQHKGMQDRLLSELATERIALNKRQECALVEGLIRAEITSQVTSYATAHRRHIIAALETLVAKYAISLQEIEQQRNAATATLTNFLKELGYE